MSTALPNPYAGDDVTQEDSSPAEAFLPGPDGPPDFDALGDLDQVPAGDPSDTDEED